MKVAVVQMDSRTDKERNIAAACRCVLKAAEAGAKLVVLPEVFSYRGPLGGDSLEAPIAETLGGATVQAFCGLAKKKKIGIVLGSIYERIPKIKKMYNTSVVVSPRGEVLAAYRKMHLFKARLREKAVSEDAHFKAGRRTACADVVGFRVGCAVCYDLRFPEMFQRYYQQGCNLLTVPSSFTFETGSAHWETLLRARAIETRSYVLAPNQCGYDGNGVRSYGTSMIIGPWGEVLAKAGSQKPTILYADIDRSETQKARKKLP